MKSVQSGKWVQSFDLERLAAGRKQGASKQARCGVATSRLCNKALNQQLDELQKETTDNEKLVSERVELYENTWKTLKQHFSAFRGWPEMVALDENQ